VWLAWQRLDGMEMVWHIGSCGGAWLVDLLARAASTFPTKIASGAQDRQVHAICLNRPTITLLGEDQPA
jgi:hypothetical protein